MFFFGYDIGGSKIEAALFTTQPGVKCSCKFETQNLHGEIVEVSLLGKQRVPTERHLGYEQIISKLSHLCKTICGEHGVQLAQLTRIGVGVPGSVDPQTQVYLKGSTFALVGKAVGLDLANALKVSCPVRCENDANLFALAEALGGAGVAHFRATGKNVSDQTGIGLILGTGVGGGIVLKGRLLSGVRGAAAEIGHSILYPNGTSCYCGRNGCAEMYLGGPALEAAFGQRRYSQIEGPMSAVDIFRMAENFEPASISVLQEYKRNLGRLLGNLATILDPDYFVFGGGLSQQKFLYEGLSDEVARNAFLSEARIPIYQHLLGDSSGVVGAGLLE